MRADLALPLFNEPRGLVHELAGLVALFFAVCGGIGRGDGRRSRGGELLVFGARLSRCRRR